MDVPGVPGGYLMGPIRSSLYKRMIRLDLGDEDIVDMMQEFCDSMRISMALEAPPTTWLLIDVTEHFLWDFDYWFANLPEVALS